MEIVEIEVEPTHMTMGGQRYRVWHNDGVLIESTKDAPHDAARELVALGADLDLTLHVYSRGSQSLGMYGRLGFFAKTRTSETDTHGPRTVPWSLYIREEKSDDD